MPPFHNSEEHPLQGLRDVIRWRWQRRGHWPSRRSFPVAPNDPTWLAANENETTLTWIGHSTFLIQLGGVNILTDPHLGERASPLSGMGPRRLVRPGLALAELPRIDLVVISHNHYDHLDRATLEAIASRNLELRCLVPAGLADRLARWGIGETHELEWWAERQMDGVHLTAVPAKHSSARNGLDRNRTHWCGWCLEHGGYRILFAGDTAYSGDFAEIRRRLGRVDLSLLPIGAYAPRWFMRHVHATPAEAVQIHLDLGSRRSVAMHWGTFVLSDEPPEEPVELLDRALSEAGLGHEDFRVLQHGETLRRLGPT